MAGVKVMTTSREVPGPKFGAQGQCDTTTLIVRALARYVDVGRKVGPGDEARLKRWSYECREYARSARSTTLFQIGVTYMVTRIGVVFCDVFPERYEEARLDGDQILLWMSYPFLSNAVRLEALLEARREKRLPGSGSEAICDRNGRAEASGMDQGRSDVS